MIDLVKQLIGHSGCKVLLYRSGESYFVRKISASEQYNDRLDEQVRKQVRLSLLVKVPRVLHQGRENGLVYFDMEYVRGHDFRTYVPLRNVSSIVGLARKVVEPLSQLVRTADGTLPEREFQTKVESVRGAVRDNPLSTRHQAILEPILADLAGADWSKIIRSECHGDMTLENMLITDHDDVVLIDPLDGSLESVWLDAAKLIHDLQTGWSLRSFLWKRELTSSDRLISMMSRYLYDEVQEQVLSTFVGIGPKLRQLRALQAVRVLPYVRDEMIFWHVVRSLDHLFQ